VFYIYAWFFTNLMVYLTYAGSMPIMYILGALHFFLAYVVYRLLFIGYNRVAYGFDDIIPLYSVRLMKWGLFLHLLFNCFMYTNNRVLTPDGYNTDLHYRPPLEPADKFFARRFNRFASFSVLLVLIVIIVIYLLYVSIVVPCRRCSEVRRQKKNINEDAQDNFDDETKAAISEDWSDDIFKEMRIKFVKDLYIRANKEFEQFRTMLNAISYDQEKLIDDDAKQFKKRLKQRIRNIEDTVDLHLNLIGALEKFMDKSYLYKIAVLELNEDKLIAKDPKVLRMVDIS